MFGEWYGIQACVSPGETTVFKLFKPKQISCKIRKVVGQHSTFVRVSTIACSFSTILVLSATCMVLMLGSVSKP